MSDETNTNDQTKGDRSADFFMDTYAQFQMDIDEKEMTLLHGNLCSVKKLNYSAISTEMPHLMRLFAASKHTFTCACYITSKKE